ncbi:MAG TPA: hypothetical protein VK801_01315 [Caulobacteraceae bacterium]|jgi:hypothetical protein|nr:hypothetical protein [Caulobacteraceae bacterium]
MEAMIPALATPLVHAVSLTLVRLATPRPEAWALVFAVVSIPGALLRHRRAHPHA